MPDPGAAGIAVCRLPSAVCRLPDKHDLLANSAFVLLTDVSLCKLRWYNGYWLHRGACQE